MSAMRGPDDTGGPTEPETLDEVLAAVENGARGDLGRNYVGADPVVDDALANLMALVRRERGGE